MKLIKKSERLTLKKMKEMEEAEDQMLQTDSLDSLETLLEEKPVANLEPTEPNYIPSRDHLPVQSVCNSGWQVSDIWRDIRLDSF